MKSQNYGSNIAKQYYSPIGSPNNKNMGANNTVENLVKR
jgi:hypothetical protein